MNSGIEGIDSANCQTIIETTPQVTVNNQNSSGETSFPYVVFGVPILITFIVTWLKYNIGKSIEPRELSKAFLDLCIDSLTVGATILFAYFNLISAPSSIFWLSMFEFFIALAAIASVTGMAMTWYLVLSSKKREKRDFEKADGIEISGQRKLLESDLYTINARIASSPYGYEVLKNIYNENLNDISLSWEVRDDSFFQSQGFDIDKMVINGNSVTCLMPFHPDYDKIYNRIVRSCKGADFICKRSDDVFKSGDIMKYTVELILKAQIIIGVLDGRNSNVFYEVGIAHAVGKPVILIAAELEKSKIPFDLQQHRFIFYKSLNDLEEKLSNALKYVKADDK